MKIAMIGGGMVGQGLGAGLAEKGHDVVLGVRGLDGDTMDKARNGAQSLTDWQRATGVRVATMAEAAAHGEIVFNATGGGVSLEALMPLAAALRGKVLVDVANALDFSAGAPAFVMTAYAGPTSLGEQIQAALPETRVVKAFNTVNVKVMVNPRLVPGDHDLFIAGNDAAAKATVADLARGFGWTGIVDLGDIVGARGTEGLLPIWMRLFGMGGGGIMNFKLVRG